MLRIWVLFLSFIFLSACSSLNMKPDKTVTLVFPEEMKIKFQGKGAGAGIALMSTMGPVGIALGVAIDEGIAKDIRKAMAKEKAHVPNYLKTQTPDLLSQKGYLVLLGEAVSKESTFPKIIIKRVGFKIINGSTDATAAEWELEFYSGPNTKVTVNYPKDFEKDTIKTYVLADLKVNGKLGIELLDESLILALDALLIKANSKK